MLDTGQILVPIAQMLLFITFTQPNTFIKSYRICTYVVMQALNATTYCIVGDQCIVHDPSITHGKINVVTSFQIVIYGMLK